MVTKESNLELFEELCKNADFSTEHIPKHGAGNVIAQSEYNGQKYECYAEWDYSWGVNWEYFEWQKVDTFENECPCCGHIKEE